MLFFQKGLLNCPFFENAKIETLYQQVSEQTALDWVITITALLYVFLAARERVSCWYWGIVSCSLWAWADFFKYNLWVDGILQLFYVGMGVYGLYSWKYGGTGKQDLAISRITRREHVQVIGLGLLLTLLFGWVFDRYTPTSYPYPDSFITAFSVLATFMTVRKKLESWLYWIVVDFLAIFLFYARDAVLVAAVMMIYTVVAAVGFYTWRRNFAALKTSVT